jgi:hypothetical protein
MRRRRQLPQILPIDIIQENVYPPGLPVSSRSTRRSFRAKEVDRWLPDTPLAFCVAYPPISRLPLRRQPQYELYYGLPPLGGIACTSAALACKPYSRFVWKYAKSRLAQ